MLEWQRRAAAQNTLANTEPVSEGQGVADAWSSYQTELDAACGHSWATRQLERLDRYLRRERLELMDRSDFPEQRRQKAVVALDRINRMTGRYQQAFDILRPLIVEASRQGRPARVLELACGTGELSLWIAEAARRESLAVEIVGSDLQLTHVQQAQAVAHQRGVEVEFRVYDALELQGVPDGHFDIVTTMQSLHHFNPAQLERLFHQAYRVSKVGLVALDLPRNLRRLPKFFLGTLALTMNMDLARDGWVSAAKAYDRVELDLIASVCLPHAYITHHTAGPDLQVLAISHPADEF